jgi:hypothetical protein
MKTAGHVIQIGQYTGRNLNQEPTEQKSRSLPLPRILCFKILLLLCVRLFYDAESTVGCRNGLRMLGLDVKKFNMLFNRTHRNCSSGMIVGRGKHVSSVQETCSTIPHTYKLRNYLYPGNLPSAESQMKLVT